MAAIVKSVEHHTVTLAAGTASDTVSLSVSSTADCLPFLAGVRCTTPNSSKFSSYLVDLYFSGGNLVVERGNSSTAAIVAEVCVVEFDTTVSNTSVEQHAFSFTTGQSSPGPTITLDATANQSKAFPYCTWQSATTDDSYGAALVFVEFEDNDTLVVDKVTAGEVTTGHCYLVQSDEFAVQAVGIYAPNASETGSISPSIVKAETFVIGGMKCGQDDFQNFSGTAEVTFTTSLVTLQRSGTSGYVQGTFYVVSMDSSVGNVQHESISAQGATASQSIDITAVTLANSIVLPTGLSGNLGGGSFPGGDAVDCPDALCAWDFVDADTIRVQHATGGGEASNDLTAQVIEWELTAAPPATTRRVMVIS